MQLVCSMCKLCFIQPCHAVVIYVTWVHTRMPWPHRWQIAIDLRMRLYFLWVFPLLCMNVCTFCCMVSTNYLDIDTGNDLPRILMPQKKKKKRIKCFQLLFGMKQKKNNENAMNVCSGSLTDKPWISFVVFDSQTEKVLFKSNDRIGLWLYR